MRTRNNIALIVITSLVFFAAIVNIAGSSLGVWSSPDKSSLEGREYAVATDHLSRNGILTGAFQSNLEQFLADRIPARDDVLLCNAELQRVDIRLAKAPFGFDCYPTFLGSKIAYSENNKALYNTPSKKTRYTDKQWRNLEKSLRKLVKNNGQVENWVLAITDSSELSLASPLNSLVNDSAGYDYIFSKVRACAPNQVKLLDLGSKFGAGEAEEYAKRYYVSDHHWQVMEGADSYRSVVEAMGRQPIDTSRAFVAFDGQFFGSYAREGLCDYVWDDVYDIDYDRSNLNIFFKKKKVDYSKVDKLWSADGRRFEKDGKFGSVGFHAGNKPIIRYENLDLDESAGSLLLIGDSYTNNNDRFYAETYKYVYSVDPRYYTSSIKKLIAKRNITDVAIVMMNHTLHEDVVQERLMS